MDQEMCPFVCLYVRLFVCPSFVS